MPKVFISYRREDSAGYAGRLYDGVKSALGSKNVFMDVDTLRPGDDFVEAIQGRLKDCDVVLAIIGPRWLATDAHGRPRLHNESDFVRIEIQSAIECKIRVIPVLVQGASVPRSEDLPEPLRCLTTRHAIDLSDTRWADDVSRLLDRGVGGATNTRGTQLRKQATPPRARESKRPAGSDISRARPIKRPTDKRGRRRPSIAGAQKTSTHKPVAVNKRRPSLKSAISGPLNRTLSPSVEQEYARGVELVEQGKAVAATKHFDTVIRLKPDFADAFYQRARALLQLGQVTAAQSDCDRAIALDPKCAEAFNVRGNLYLNDDPNSALTAYNSAISLKPKFAKPYYNRALIKHHRRDFSGSAQDCSTAIRLQPDFSDAYYIRGLALMKNNEWVAARSDFDQAIRLRPDFVEAFYCRATAKRGEGDLAGALKDYDKAISLQPKLAVAYRLRGDFRRSRGDFAGALEDYNMLIRLQPTDTEAFVDRGNVKNTLGDSHGAQRDLDEAKRLKRNPVLSENTSARQSR